MTSPGSWFGGFLNDSTSGKPPTTPGSSSGPVPKNKPGLPNVVGGAAGAATRAPVITQEASKTGQVLYDALDMPKEWADDAFTMGTNDQGQLLRMTVGAGLEWFRNMSVKNRDDYNAWLVKLYDAGYLSEKDLRFGAYTSTAGQAFVEAAYDTAMMNLDPENGGGVVSLGDNLQHIADGAAAMGGPGGGAKAPVRVDQQLDDETLKQSLRDTSRNLLGRALTDSEEASLVGRFRSVESAWNDQSWNAQQHGGTVNSAPKPDAIGEDAIKEGPLGTERAAQQLGGYAGVLMNMVGLSGATSIGGTLG